MPGKFIIADFVKNWDSFCSQFAIFSSISRSYSLQIIGLFVNYAVFNSCTDIIGVLPSKDGAEKDKVIVISTLQEHQNTTQPGMQTETLAFCEAEGDHPKERPGQCIEVSEAK